MSRRKFDGRFLRGYPLKIVFARPHENAKNANTAERACVLTMRVYIFDLRALFQYFAIRKTGSKGLV